MRNLPGFILTLIAAAAALVSVFRPWYAGRDGSDIRFGDLFDELTAARPDNVMVSLFLPMLVGAIIAVVGAVLRSRLLLALASLVVLATTVLWMVRQSLTAAALRSDLLGDGLALAVGGGLALLVAAGITHRHHRAGRHRRHGRRLDVAPPPEDEHQPPEVGPDQTGAPPWRRRPGKAA